ncbi:MAG TPA: spermidine/putrescine ABC transporter substrate-binding protein, partial [Candidatus Methylomirabilis sp.]|nr:spermidine/putrescine ABC transporter substrate-binding protein [Candidatus Methylomirabilis sp.]
TLGLLLVACTPAAEEAPPEGQVQELNIYNWSTYIAPDTIPNFEEQYNVKVNYDLFGDNEELLAKIQPGNPGYDIIVPTDYMVTAMINLGLLEELNHDNIPNMANVHPTFLDPDYDPGNAHCLPYQWGTMGLGYNITATGGEIDSWSVMFDEKYAGRISWLDDPRSVIGIALLYLGFSMNTTDPGEIEQAKQLMVEHKQLVAAFAPDTGQILLDEGEVDIAHEWSGDIFQIMEENPDIRYVIPKEGSMVWTDNMCIPKGAPHKELAEQFINYILDPQVGADLSNYIRYGTPNQASLPLINEEDLNNPGIYPPEETMANLQFLVDLGEATLLYDEAWTEIKTEG